MYTYTRPPLETIFYQDEKVTVSQSRFIANGKTYAMRNISSVSIFTIEKSKVLYYVLMAIGIFIMLNSNSINLGGLIIVGVSVWLIYRTKNPYSVQISSNSGESKAITSEDKEYIQKIVSAVNEAIVHLG